MEENIWGKKETGRIKEWTNKVWSICTNCRRCVTIVSQHLWSFNVFLNITDVK